MARLFIAEKPSLGRAIAEVIGATKNEKHCIHCKNGDTVTWCAGHLLELAYPDEYTTGRTWTRESLPIIPDKWKYNVRETVKEQYKAVVELIKKATHIVHAGDPDREGQLLVDEVLERAGWKGITERIWLASMDRKSVQKALAELRPNDTCSGLRDAARARSLADWLIGMNATRAFTIVGKETGYLMDRKSMSLGRVQTPTLALVVDRDLRIENFVPETYLRLEGRFLQEDQAFTGIYQPLPEDSDSEGRLTNTETARRLASELAGREGTVISSAAEKKTRAVPLPHCLSSLQKEMSASIGLSAKETLDAAQSLYEKRLTTYPRSDCRYLPEEQTDAAPDIITALGNVFELARSAGAANLTLRSTCWNTAKITAHHAIIPTGEKLPAELSANERAVYLAVATAYILQFHAPCEYESRKMIVNIDGHLFEAKGRKVLNPGWTEYLKLDEEEEQSLPLLKEGSRAVCTDLSVQHKKTTPPSRFTEGTLIEAMTNVHRFLSKDSGDAREILKETQGIGTEATRANIIDTLKRQGYLEPRKKTLVSTEQGRRVIQYAPAILKDPLLTAQWEKRMADIASGKDTLNAFLDDQKKLLPTLLETIFGTLFPALHTCPSCGSPLKRVYSKKAEGFFWVCRSEAHGDRAVWYREQDGSPVFDKQFCPVCNGPLFLRTKGPKPFWGCWNTEKHPDGKPYFCDDKNGTPDIKSSK